MSPLLMFLVLIASTRSQEVTTPSSFHGDNIDIAFEAEQYLQSLKIPEATKQGPVLFPNDGPPPPRLPLIVTSRPLLESISRSDVAASNSTVAESQNRVSFIPNFLGRVKQYKPFGFFQPKIPYADVVKKYRVPGDNRFDDYEEQTLLPPIYKALSDHANKNVLKINNVGSHGTYQVKEPTYSFQNYQEDDQPRDHYTKDKPQNYAFSYAVKDRKTGDDFSHSQQSSGSATNGEYRVRLPDGRMQIVSYTADENGYKADVRYDDSDNHITNDNDKNDHRAGHNENVIANQDYNNNVQAVSDYVNRNGYNDKYQGYGSDEDYKQQRDASKVNERDYNNNYPDSSKEYYNDDYSSEFNSNYAPYKSKFASFSNVNKDISIASTVKPSYEELRDLFVNKNIYNTQQKYNDIPVQINVPSTVPDYSLTTERVVVIGKKPNLYTSIRNPSTIDPYLSPTPSTPRSYLVSTITNLQNKINLVNKPILSNSYIDKINKYLTFT